MTPDELLQVINQTAIDGVKELDLAGHHLTSLPPEIGKLTQLETLILGKWDQKNFRYIGNQLSQLPAEIGQLTRLQKLDLRSNQLSKLPVEIGQLTSLQKLDLRSNQLSKLPAEIGQLTSLQKLDLRSNQLSKLPAEIGQLTSLQKLDLSANQLSQLPIEIGQLTHLQLFDLSYNRLNQLPTKIGQLTSLRLFDLRSNQLNQLPAEIGQLSRLQQLDLSFNQLSQLPAEIGQLTNLKELDLENNQLDSLPHEIEQLIHLIKIDLRDNDLPIPPEILGDLGYPIKPAKIFAFYRQLQTQETDRLYEAKLLIIGEPGAGKTTLTKKIEDENYILDANESSTEGIEVVQWSFPLDNGETFQVNIWDFGGQEIYHATHQFFLTKRSLYTLVADSRKEDTDFNYWLNVVELLSDNSPLLIVKNEKQDRKREINQKQLRGEFTNLKEVLATNLQTKRGLPEILDTIRYHIQKLPHIGTPLPKTWVQVRQALEHALETDHRNYISLDEYLRICEDNGFTKRDDKLQLSCYLHDLGVCLHFQEDPLLKKTVILNPTWGTNAVYAVLDNPDVVANLGQFTKDDLAKIWHQEKYSTMQDELLQLMMKFKLCYEISGCPGTYIAPQLLSPERPDYDWDDDGDDALTLRMKYQYEFMPKGILTRFIVEMHQWIDQQTCVWKTGVVLNQDQQNHTKAQVIERYRAHNGEITIRVSGRRPKDLLTVITYELDKIHTSYDHLKYDKLIPCNCTTCRNSVNPHFYQLDMLRRALAARKDPQCQISFETVNARRLLDDVFEPQTIEKELYPTHTKDQTPANVTISGSGHTIVVQPNEEVTVMGKKTAKSSWANGLFYLFVFVVVIAAIGFTAGTVNMPTLALIIFGGVLFIPIIGALQLIQDKSISEPSFLKLMGMVFENLPVIKHFLPKKPPTDED